MFAGNETVSAINDLIKKIEDNETMTCIKKIADNLYRLHLSAFCFLVLEYQKTESGKAARISNFIYLTIVLQVFPQPGSATQRSSHFVKD